MTLLLDSSYFMLHLQNIIIST